MASYPGQQGRCSRLRTSWMDDAQRREQCSHGAAGGGARLHRAVVAARSRTASFRSQGRPGTAPAARGPREVRRRLAKSGVAEINVMFCTATLRRDRTEFGSIQHVSFGHSSEEAINSAKVRSSGTSGPAADVPPQPPMTRSGSRPSSLR